MVRFEEAIKERREKRGSAAEVYNRHILPQAKLDEKEGFEVVEILEKVKDNPLWRDIEKLEKNN